MADAVDELTYWRDEAERYRQESRDSATQAGRAIRERDEARAEVGRLRVEHAEVLERLHVDYNGMLNKQVRKFGEVEAELARYRRAVAKVRESHKPEWFAGINACLACSPGMPPPILIEWPCPTIKAIEEATKP